MSPRQTRPPRRGGRTLHRGGGSTFAPQQQVQFDPLPPDHRLDDRQLLEKANSLERRHVRPWLAQAPGDLGGDLEAYYKSLIAQQYRMVSGDYGVSRQIAGFPPFKVMEKALLTTTVGGFNPLFSYAAIAGIAVEANTWNMMPKVSWRTRTLGWRSKTAAAIASAVGIPEGDPVPADIDPTWVEITPTIKETLQATGVSIRAREAATIADMITENQHVASTLEDLMRAQNADLMGAVFGVEGNHVERLRNLVCSNGEVTGKTGGANNADPWLNIDRDAGAGWSDANVLHASGTDRDLEISLIDQLFQNQRQFWDSMENKVYLTGDTTLRVWSELEEAKERIGEVRAQFTVGGIKSVKGQDVGVVLSGYRGDPIIPDSQMTIETIDDIMYLDLDHTFIAQLLPMQTVSEDNLFITGTNSRTAFYAIWEQLMTKFGGNGVLTDLQ